MQQTWNRSDALEFANIFADHMMPDYRLLIESYDKAQSVATKGGETVMDAAQIGKRGMQPAGMET
jgi:hypothetical protein